MKRRGPLVWIAGRSRSFWYTLILVPSLYALSLPPLVGLHFRNPKVFAYRSVRATLFGPYLMPIHLVDEALSPELHDRLWIYLTLFAPAAVRGSLR